MKSTVEALREFKDSILHESESSELIYDDELNEIKRIVSMCYEKAMEELIAPKTVGEA